MCGIFGITYIDNSILPDKIKLSRSNSTLGHRGPDGSGIFAESGIGLAHTRLSLVDLTDLSSQPFYSADKRFVLVYNGEVYNFKTLRQELQNQGIKFRTTGDTEVVLECLRFYGVKQAITMLKGMFAFALYDRKEKILTLGRDRFGIKPLALYYDGITTMFSSEIKAFSNWVTLKPDLVRITSYLLGSGYPTKGTTFFKNVSIVAPGSIVTQKLGEAPVSENVIHLASMIDPELQQKLRNMGPEAATDRLDEILSGAVKDMLFADAPVGALCSGGVDSSIVMAMAAKYHNNLAIFHANVLGPTSEYEAARTLADHLKLDLKTVEVKDRDFVDLIPDITYHYEHPYEYHANSCPFLMVSRLVRQHGVKGVLSGEGSDECFLGYAQFAREPFIEFYRSQLQHIRNLVMKIPSLGKFLVEQQASFPDIVRGMLGRFETEIENKEIYDRFHNVIREEPGRRTRTVELLSYHLRTVLHRNDCLGMAASIEARFPFLDEELVKTAINLPQNHKIRFSPFTMDRGHPFFRDKWIIRKVADRYLPVKLSQRKKIGFWVTAFGRMKIKPEFLENSSARDLFSLNQKEMSYLVEHADVTLKRKLLLLDSWSRIHMDKEDLESVRNKLHENVEILKG